MFRLEYSKLVVSDGPVSMCVKLLTFLGGQVGRSLEATALCVAHVSWYSACVSIGHSYCRSTVLGSARRCAVWCVN